MQMLEEVRTLSRGPRTAIAGMVGAVVAFGLAELVHGIYGAVPSVFVSLAQLVVEFTPGEFATRAIETLGQADVPVLVASMVTVALGVSALLARLALTRPALALAVVGLLGAIGIVACFAAPFFAPVPTVMTILGSLAAGASLTAFLISPAEEVPEEGGPVMEVRRRDAHAVGGMWMPRRNFVLISGAAAAAGILAATTGRALSGGRTLAEGPKALDIPRTPPPSAETTTADAAEKEITHTTLPPVPDDASIDAPGMLPFLTPARDFYLIDTALSSPRVDRPAWRLQVKGAVDNPFEMTYEELLSLSTREADVTLSCVSNEVGGGLVSNGRWTGVLLSDVLREAGVVREKLTAASEQLVGRSVDGWTAGFRTELALDGREALVAFGLNGSELPVAHGYPVRLVVPGLYGYVSATKWLKEIELTDWDFDAYWIKRTWAKEGPIRTQSRIDTLREGQRLEAGKVVVGGIAWAPHRGIERVEVSTDGGESWEAARLAVQVDEDSWRQYAYEWDAKPGEYEVRVRATDGEGETQTSERQRPHPSGATGHHTVSVTVA